MARIRARRRARVTAVAAGFLMLGACSDAPSSIEEFEAATGSAAPVQPATSAATPARIPEVVGGQAPIAPAEGSTPEADRVIGFGDGALVADTALAALGGERSLAQVALYDGYGIVVSLAANGDVDRVVVRGGRAEEPSPVPSAIVRDPAGARFGAGDVDWAVIPSLVERTPGELGIDGGTVSHVIVEKNIPFTPDLVIRVYVSTERRSGRIDYFADGRPMRAFPG